MDEFVKEIRADERMKIFDIEYGDDAIVFKFAGKFAAKLYERGGMFCVMNTGYGSAAVPGRIYNCVLFCAGDLGRALENREWYRDGIVRGAGELEKFLAWHPTLARTTAIKFEPRGNCVAVGLHRYYLDGKSSPYVMRGEHYLRYFTICKALRDALPMPIADEIIDCAALIDKEFSWMQNTIALMNCGWTAKQLEQYVEEALANAGQKITYFEEQLARYDAAEREIAALYPRAAKILPPLLTAGGYSAGRLSHSALPTFAEIESYLAAKK